MTRTGQGAQIVDRIDRTVDCYAPAADLYDDPLVLLPAVPNDWAGRFRLRARGGFLVSVVFQRNRRPVEVRIESERGQTLTLANPFAECQVARNGKPVLTSQDAMLSMRTSPGDVLVVTATGAGRP